VGEVRFAPRAARDVKLAACAVGEAFTVGEASAPFTVDEASPPFTVDEAIAPFTVGEAIAPLTVDEAIAPLTVDEAIAPCALGAAPTPSAVDDMSVGAFARASGGTSRSTPATAARFSSSPTVE